MAEQRASVFSLEDTPGEQPHENTLLRTMLTKDVVGPEFSLSVLELKKGGGHEWHATNAFGEALFILEGEGVVEVEGQEDIKYRPGMAIVIPRGVRHQHINRGDGIIRAVIVHFPGRK